MTHTTSTRVFSAVQHLLDAGLLTTTAPWHQGHLEHLASTLAPEWGMAVSTDNVVVALPNPPRASGFPPRLSPMVITARRLLIRLFPPPWPTH
jgi:hypothetical protein